MEVQFKRSAFAAALWLTLSLNSSTVCPATASQEPATGHSIRSHDLFVQIDPERHALTAVDRITMNADAGRPIRLSLSPTLRLDRVVWSPSASPPDERGRDVPFTTDDGAPAGST